MAQLQQHRRRWRRRLVVTLVAVSALYGLLLIPQPRPQIETPGGGASFVWDLDTYWTELEQGFGRARKAGCESLAAQVEVDLLAMADLIRELAAEQIVFTDPRLDSLEEMLFSLAVSMAACPQRMHDYLNLAVAARAVVKDQSRHWEIGAEAVKQRLYRLLYGSRAAVEEAMLQQPHGSYPSLLHGEDLPSVTPTTAVHGVRVHSGDLLVSRGGAPTSALIARGNDYPGNFSHVALVHVSEDGEVSIIEAHIECGVTVSTVEAYFEDTKLRVMVLRLRAELAPVRRNPMLPHEAATGVLERVRREHIPYDFAMDFTDRSQLFCSEVASTAYQELGISLWMELSQISGSGIESWLADLGVRHFKTQAPSDLEYDPQLVVVAEWRDPATLWQDHVDNAVTDAMISQADRGSRLQYNWMLLPLARVVKLYSWLINGLGKTGPIPEGMSATAALKHGWYSARHRRLKQMTLAEAEQLEKEKGYRPPYWQLVAIAKGMAEQL
jgi:hypothetical protein